MHLKKQGISFLLLSISVLIGCSDQEVEDAPVYDNSEEVEAYYEAHPDRFVFASMDKLPGGLVWNDGAELTTFGDPRATRGGELKLRLGSMQQTLRVMGPDANGSLRGPLWSANFVNLLERHPFEEGYIPGLASHWAKDPDDRGTVYLKLDPDARWSDGKPFSIDDVLFSFYFLLSPHLNEPSVNRVFDENIARITRYDEQTLAITQTKPGADPLFGISTFILSQRDFYREFGPDYVDRYHWRFAPVTGPYSLDESRIKRGRQITFDRLENWWADDKPFYRHRFNPDQMTYVVIRDDDKAFESFLRGDIDWFFLQNTSRWYDQLDAPAVRDGYIERAWFYHQLPSPSEGIHMNAMDSLLADRNLRVGIQYAMDYERVNEGLYRGDRRRIRSFSDGYGDYSHPSLRARSFDPARAAEYFGSAGFTARGSDGILANESGRRLSFVLTVANRGNEVTEASILKEAARSAGLELVIELLDTTAFFTKIFEKKHQLAKTSWNTGYAPVPTFEWELREKDAGQPGNFNTTNIRDDQLSQLLASWDKEVQSGAAQLIAHQVQERVHDFAAWVPGLAVDYDRLGYWRWVRWPDYFQVPRYFFFAASGVFWIDEGLRQETLRAQEAGEAFPRVSEIHERWRRD